MKVQNSVYCSNKMPVNPKLRKSRFGMCNYHTRDGYYNEYEQKGIEIREYKKFSNLTFADIIKELGGKDKMSAETYSKYEIMFRNIAGEDMKISTLELSDYFQSLQKAAGDDKMLDHNEIIRMAQARNEHPKDERVLLGLAVRFDPDNQGKLPAFIKAVISANDKKVRAYEAKEKYEKDNTTVDKYGNSTFHKKVDEEDDNYQKIVERFETKDKAGNVIAKGYINEDGTKYTDIIKNGIRQSRVAEYKNGSKYIHYYENPNKPEQVTKEVCKDDGYEHTKNFTYDSNDRVIKEVYTNNRYTTTTNTTYVNGKKTKEVETSSNGTIKTTTFNSAETRVKEVEVDKDKDSITTLYSPDNGYQRIKTIYKNPQGKVVSVTTYKYDKERNCLSEEDRAFDNPKAPVIERRTFDALNRELKERTEYDSTGKKVLAKVKYKNEYPTERIENIENGDTKITTYVPGSYNILSEVTKNGQGNVIKYVENTYTKGNCTKVVTKENGKVTMEETISYNAQNQEAKRIVKHADGKIERYEYSRPNEFTTIVKEYNADDNSMANLSCISQHTHKGKKWQDTLTYYKNGQPIAVEICENFAKNKYTTPDGTPITKEEFRSLIK